MTPEEVVQAGSIECEAASESLDADSGKSLLHMFARSAKDGIWSIMERRAILNDNIA